MAEHNFVGKIGENLARKYLEDNGYKILEQNYKTKYAEIDLIAEKSAGFFGKSTLVFVEVRSKTGEQFGTPEETLNYNKLNRLVRAAFCYMARYPGKAYRLDAVCVVFDPSGKITRLTHHENISE